MGLDSPTFDAYGHYWGEEFPAECVRECSASGAVDDAVESWRVQLGFVVPRDKAIQWLREFGAWPMESDKYDTGLNDTDDDTLARRVLWLACCEVNESGEPWTGLIH